MAPTETCIALADIIAIVIERVIFIAFLPAFATTGAAASRNDFVRAALRTGIVGWIAVVFHVTRDW
jgi:hypothetical protein